MKVPAAAAASGIDTTTTNDSGYCALQSQSIDVQGQENFYQGCSFSPDGLCVLTSTAADGKVRLYNTFLPSDNDGEEEQGGTKQPITDRDSNLERGNVTINTTKVPPSSLQPWEAALTVSQGDVVRSYAWYPLMTSQDPSTCAFVTARRGQPVHLVDAYTGALRATYRPMNRLDELEAPTVVHFSSPQRLVCGGFRTDRVLYVFDPARPGHSTDVATVVRLGQTRRSTDGQKGLVSALASTTSSNGQYLAVGTYAPGSIYLYDWRMAGSSQTVLSSGEHHNSLCIVGHGRNFARKKRPRHTSSGGGGGIITTGTATANTTLSQSTSLPTDQFFQQAKSEWFQRRAQGGVTQLQFCPMRDHILYSASRRADCILMWDLRVLSDLTPPLNSSNNTNAQLQYRPVQGLGSFATQSQTNQRLEFDVSHDGQRLFVGGMDKCVRIYDTQSGTLVHQIKDLEDSANGVSFAQLSNHHSNDVRSSQAYLAVATGSRRFLTGDPGSGSDDDEGTGQVEDESSIADMPPGSLRLYRLGKEVLGNGGSVEPATKD